MRHTGKSFVLAAYLMIAVNAYGGQPQYYDYSNFLAAPSTTFNDGLLGFVNPATLNFVQRPQWQFRWSTDATKVATFNNWGAFTAVPHLGFGVQHQHFGELSVTDYRISTGFGTRAHSSGLAYGWSSGDNTSIGRQRTLTTASVIRPLRYLSVGVTGNFGLQTGAQEWIGEIGIRPLGDPIVTLFADAAWAKRERIENVPWSVGAAVQLARGIDLTGRLFDGDSFTLGVSLNFGKAGLASQSHYNTDGDYSYQTYMLRGGGAQPSAIADALGKDRRYFPIELHGRVDYLRYKLFDQEAIRFFDVVRDIEAAADDPRVSVIAVNVSSLRIAPEHAWEIRQALKAARHAGKQVIAFIDRGEMTSYHLASVADRVVMDPEGMLILEGYLLGKTYFKGTLAKLGLGFDEWRYFKYKSAVEVLSRESMSDADREQYQAYVDDWYELTRSDVCSSRSLKPAQFDRVIDEQVLLLPAAARDAGLVDTVARWSEVGKVIRRWTDRSMHPIAGRDLSARLRSVHQWGPRPRIALVYGLGECAMDTGIRARWLEKVLLRLARDRSIDAVVFRVDSPGGDGMASDVVAEALRKCSRAKPVIVSQGQVAGSGGYWISMYADTIVAGPTTITGSIGVIGGWIYDTGLSDKLGMTSDHVKRGRHADINAGIRLPFIGAKVPARDLTDEERAKVEKLIQDFYTEFVGKVAQGRGLSTDSVRAIGEGRFYSGIEGKALGLVDEIGGLSTALAVAKLRAGLSPGDDVEIVEIPEDKGLLRLPSPRVGVSTKVADDPLIRYIRMAIEHNGRPLPMLLPGTYPTAD